jgi:hypothetical protein
MRDMWNNGEPRPSPQSWESWIKSKFGWGDGTKQNEPSNIYDGMQNLPQPNPQPPKRKPREGLANLIIYGAEVELVKESELKIDGVEIYATVYIVVGKKKLHPSVYINWLMDEGFIPKNKMVRVGLKGYRKPPPNGFTW